MGALARPHERLQETKARSKLRTRTVARVFMNDFMHCERVAALALKSAWTSCAALIKALVPPPCTHSTGAALVASASVANELALPTSIGLGADAAFSIRRRTGVRAVGAEPPPARVRLASPMGLPAGCRAHP